MTPRPAAAAPAQSEASRAQVSAVSGSAARAVSSLCQSSIQSRARRASSSAARGAPAPGAAPRPCPAASPPGVLPSLPLLPSIPLAHRGAEAYARSRPRGSQLSALTSRQSRVVASRAELEKRLAENDAKFGGKDVPVPENWGGYLLRPEMFEFWQGRDNRLHDRLVYRAAGQKWRVERLEP